MDLASAGLAGASEDLLLYRGFSGDAARELWEGGSPTVGRRASSAGYCPGSLRFRLSLRQNQ